MEHEAEERNLLTAAVRRAQRRVMANRVLWEAGLAATIALLGPTLFLLLGRDWFAWPLLILFVVGGIGVAAWRLWRKRPNLYRVAQVLDARLTTHDQISTAIYYLESQDTTVGEQRRAAVRLAERMDLETAFPFTLPRSLYGLASVFLVASALCALRYLLEKPLRLDRPLPTMIVQAVRGPELVQQRQREKAKNSGRQVPQKQDQAPAVESNTPANRLNGRQAQEITVPTDEGTPEKTAKGAKADADKNADQQNAQSADPAGDPMAGNASDDPIQSYEDMLERDAKSGLQKAQGKPGQDPGKNQDGKNSGSQDASNSLLAKLKDAMGNMLSRLGQKAPGQGQQQQQAANGNEGNGSEQKDGQGDGQGGAGQPKPGGKQATGSEGAATDSQDMAAQNAGRKASGKTSDQNARGQAGSGAGRQEGQKQLQEAQEQAAMGKLSELYGRRAANVSGEVTVETQAGKQTLRTPEADKQARHSDSGGEVSRDEIPLAYQAYVKEYFNKLRQESNATAKK